MRRCGDATDNVTFPWTFCCLETPCFPVLSCPRPTGAAGSREDQAGITEEDAGTGGWSFLSSPACCTSPVPCQEPGWHSPSMSSVPLSCVCLSPPSNTSQPVGLAEQQQQRGGCQWAGAALFLHQLLHRQPSAGTGPWIGVWGGVCATAVPFLLPLGVVPPARAGMALGQQAQAVRHC